MTQTADSPAATEVAQTAQQVKNVVVVGAGQMGSGIAQVFATAGRSVWLADIDELSLERARRSVASSAGRLHSKGQLTDEQAGWVESNISYVTTLGSVKDADIQLAVEAVVENLETKERIFRELDTLLPAGAVLSSNTSSIPITRLAASTSRPGQVVGMHFMNPPAMLDLVEVVPGLETSPQVVDLISSLSRDIGKTPVIASDSAGFITNRVLMPLINEAFFCLQENVGTAEGIDTAMRLGMRHPMGPLALADLIGLDTCLAILEVLHEDLGDDKYRPCPLLRRYVDAGRLGRKSGAGVYPYER